MVPEPAEVAVKSFLIADQVFQQASGKWCVIGIFSKIQTLHFPALHQNLGLYVSLANCQGSYDVRVEFEDSQGRCLATLSGIRFEASDRLAPCEFGLQTFGLLLPAAGVYFVKLYFNGKQAASDIRFEAVQLEVPSADR